MTSPAPYGSERARRSLRQFFIGKSMSAAAGIAWLVLVVRMATPEHYGSYVAGVALVEVFYLCTGFGLSTMAQRYVPEFHLKASARQFNRLLARLVLLRFVFAVAGALLVVLAWSFSVQWLAGVSEPALRWLLPAWLVLGSCARYVDELLPALLMQGVSQGLSLLANLTRLAALPIALHAAHKLDVATLVSIEIVCSVATVVLGALALYGACRRNARRHVDHGSSYRNDLAWAVSARFFLVQLLGQAWGPNLARLLVARLSGAVAVAMYGFAQALVDLLRNYLPVYLLAGWLRPLLVARYVEDRRTERVVEILSLAFKLSLAMVLPVIAVMPAYGDALASWVSGGRYRAGVGVLMTLLLLLLALQALHLCVGMLSATVERAGANVQATAACALTLPAVAAGWGWWGVHGMLLALIVAEVGWITWVVRALRREGFAVAGDGRGVIRLTLVGILAMALVSALPPAEGSQLLWPAALSVGLVLAGVALFRPWTVAERGLLARIIPVMRPAR